MGVAVGNCTVSKMKINLKIYRVDKNSYEYKAKLIHPISPADFK